MNVGEEWAYREAANKPLVQVRIEGIGTKRPLRYKIAHLDDRYEGRTEWVPGQRLKVLWADRQTLVESEARWDTVQMDGRPNSDERDAAWDVFVNTAGIELIDISGGGAMGIGTTSEPAKLAAMLGWQLETLSDDEGSFVEDGMLHLRWSTTKRIAMTLAQQNTVTILRVISESEIARDKRVHAAVMERIFDLRAYNEVRSELLEHWPDREMPWRKVLREWCGAEQVSLFEELKALQTRYAQMESMARRALPELERVKTKRAAQLASELSAALMPWAHDPNA